MVEVLLSSILWVVESLAKDPNLELLKTWAKLFYLGLTTAAQMMMPFHCMTGILREMVDAKIDRAEMYILAVSAQNREYISS